MASVITIADVRDEMLDRQAEDNLVLADLAFTDEDIMYGMKACARAFNGMRPYVGCAVWDELPENSPVFFDGIAWKLYRRWGNNAAVNDVDYNAGGVRANVQNTLVKNLERLAKNCEEEFKSRGTELKIHMNLQQAYGPIG